MKFYCTRVIVDGLQKDYLCYGLTQRLLYQVNTFSDPKTKNYNTGHALCSTTFIVEFEQVFTN